MATEQILITVRTYPNLSESYQETVCTGGINSKGQWRRIYPVQWRMLDKDKQYHQYDIIEVLVKERYSDGRKESRRIDTSTIVKKDHLHNWKSRADWVKPTIVNSLVELKSQNRTIGPVMVDQVKDFIVEHDDPDWSPKHKELLKQSGLFGGPDPLEKIPFIFRLIWVDGDGHEYTSQFIDWEVCQTWRKYRWKYDDPVEKMIEKYMNDRFCDKNAVVFYMGNYRLHPQHFGVCGAFYPPKKEFEEESLWS